MKLKLFQKQDLARAALHDGLILSWDTGLGKTWAMFLWPLLKLGYEKIPDPSHTPDPSAPDFSLQPSAFSLRPKGPVLIIAPGDLHQQIRNEAWTHFRIPVTPLDSQAAFDRLTAIPGSPLTRRDPTGRPLLAPGCYLTSYTQLATNGVASPRGSGLSFSRSSVRVLR